MSEFCTFIRKFIAFPIQFEEKNSPLANNDPYKPRKLKESRIKIVDSRFGNLKYTVKIRPTKVKMLFIIYNLLISISILLGFVKFFVNPGLNGPTSPNVLFFYNNWVIFSFMLLLFFFIQLYYLLEILNLQINFEINKVENELKIYFKNFIRSWDVSKVPLKSVSYIELTRTNLKDIYSIEIVGTNESFIEYPLNSEDALQLSLVINKSLRF